MLRQVHMYLIKNLNLTTILLDSMVSCDLISSYDRQRLLLTPEKFKVNAQLMHTLHRKPGGCYKKLVECLKSSGQEQLGQTCEASREFDLTSYKDYLKATLASKLRQKSFFLRLQFYFKFVRRVWKMENEIF